MRRFLPWLVVATGLFAVPVAQASTPYAEAMDAVMPCTPQCTLCHTTNLGGLGQLSAFGQTMKTTGMLPPVVGDPVAAFNRLAAADTDGDGKTDVDEVSAGENPSVPGQATLCSGGPQYGCGASIARPARHGLATALGAFTALALGAIALRRRAAGSKRPR